jgi:hypothetical protein
MSGKKRFWGLLPLVGYILLMPFYLFPPGSPQIADFLMLVISASMLFGVTAELPRKVKTIVAVMMMFVAYSVVVNSVFAMSTQDVSLLKSPLFYFFNLVSFVCLVKYYQVYKEDFLRVVALTVAVSLCIQMVVMLADLHPGARGVRTTLWFNNPNQLGYWSLLSVSIVALAVTRIRIPTLLLLASLVAGTFLVVLCLSKAATAGMVMLFALIALRKPIVIVVALVAIGGVIATPAGGAWVDALQHRLDSVGQQDDDTAEGRGYDRIVEHPQYLIFGSGEGDYQRWYSTEGRDKEIHSSFGSMLFCYGAIGFILFSAGIALILGNSLASWLYCVPLMLYGVTHNGLRFTSFWLFIAFAFCMAIAVREERERALAEASGEGLTEAGPSRNGHAAGVLAN